MQGYMERKLVGVHEAGSAANLKEKSLRFIVGLTFIVVMPYLHIGIFYSKIWTPDKPNVKDLRRNCSCSCFDTVFRGRYEYPVSEYKHVYFNATSTTLKIWFVTAMSMLLAYEAVKSVVHIYRIGKLRKNMLYLLISSIYAHYYSWWSYFNYHNEEFYDYYYHHMIFAVTEVISSCLLLHLCNRQHDMLPWKLLWIFNINLCHILVSGIDQFVEHVIFMKGFAFQNARDVGLMVPDILHIFVVFNELKFISLKENVSIPRLFFREEIMLSLLYIILFIIFASIL